MAPSPPPLPPAAPRGWQGGPPARRNEGPRSRRLGVPTWVLPTGVLPVAPLALLGLVVPEFVAPLRDVWPAIGAVLAVLVLANVVAGRARSPVVPAVSIVFTTSVGILVAVLGPAVVLIAENLG